MMSFKKDIIFFCWPPEIESNSKNLPFLQESLGKQLSDITSVNTFVSLYLGQIE